MKLKSCEFCGTEYNEELSKCPLCGKSEMEAELAAEEAQTAQPVKAAPKKKAKRHKAPKEERIPRWMWAVICAILGIAVIIGLVYFLVSMGYVGKEEAPAVPAQSVVEEQPQQTPQPEEVVTEPEQPDVELDLSCVGLTLSQTGIIMDVEGAHVFLTAVPAPLDCEDPIVFTSADPAIAAVDENGMITAIAPGQTEIVVTCGDVTEMCTIVCDFEVEEEPAEPEEQPDEPVEPEEPETVEPTLSSEDFTLFTPGEETTLRVKNAPAGAVITYTSSNPAVASVTANGVVTAVGDGTATITVMVNDLKLICMARCNLGVSTENNEEDQATEVSGPLHLFNPYGNAEDVMLFRVGETFSLTLRDSANTAVSGVSWSTSNAAVCTVDAGGTVSASGSGTATVTASYNGQTYSCIVRCNF